MQMPLNQICKTSGELSIPADISSARTSEHGLTVSHIDAAEWDNLAAGFRDVIHEQTECFNAPRWGADRLKRITFKHRGQLVGACVARMLPIPLTGVRMIVVRWGPLWRPAGQPNDPEMLGRIYQAIREAFATTQGDYLLVIPRSDPETSSDDVAMLARAGFTSLEPEASPERYFVNVAIEPDAIRSSLSQKWRYNLKKAEKAGLQSAYVDGSEGLSQFRALYDQMLERKQFFDASPVDTLENLFESRQSELQPKVWIVSKDGEPVTGAVVDCSGERAIYLYGASSRSALPLRAGYLMQWDIITYLTAQPQIHWYDLGGGSSPTCSLHQFKRGLSGTAGVVSEIPPFHFYATDTRAAIIGGAVLSARTLKDRLQMGLNNRIPLSRSKKRA